MHKATLLLLCPAAALVSPTTKAATYEVAEVRLKGGSYENPFSIACSVQVQGPAHSSRAMMNLSLFYDGNQEWAFRFSPDVPGTWNWRSNCGVPQYKGCYQEDTDDRDMPHKVGTGVSVEECQRLCAGHKFFGQHYTRECWCGDSYGKHGKAGDCRPSSAQMEDAGKAGKKNAVYSVKGVNDPGLDGQQGSIDVVQGTQHGGIVQDPDNKQMFAYEDGTKYLLVGLEADWLWALGLKGDDTEGYLKNLQSFGFNHYLVQVYSNHSSWNAELPPWQRPRYSPSVPSLWASTDQTVLDLDYLQNMDSLLSLMDTKGLVAHLMLYVGNKNVVWPTRGSLADEIYWRQVLARFSAYNSVLWDVSKESGSYGVGKPYTLDRLQYITDTNAHNRLVTAHSGLEWSNRCTESSSDTSLCTMATRQAHYQSKGDPLSQEPYFYDDMIHALSQDPNIPVSNLEFFYEAGASRACAGSCCNGCATSADQVHAMRRVMWDLYMAGGSGAWYNCDVSWDVIIPTTNSTGFNYVKHLSDFWTQVDFSQLQRTNDLINTSSSSTVHCSTGGTDVVVHSRAGAAFTVNLPIDSISSATWYDPVSGKSVPAKPSNSGSVSPTYSPPRTFEDDAVLHVKTSSRVFV